MIEQPLIMLVSLLGCILSAYFDMRKILWSIIWLEKKGKRRKLKDLRIGVRIGSQITMNYLLEYAGSHKRQFLFWCRFKRWCLFVESVLWILNVCIIVFTPLSKPYEIACIILCAQGLLLFLFMNLQFDRSWRTKYDRMH